MRSSLWSRIILSALLVALAVPAAARPEEEETPKAKTQKKRQVSEAAAPTQTQTAPAARQEKGKAQTAPGKAGFRAIQGTVTGVSQERNTVLIRTVNTEYLVFITPKTVLLRDGKPAALNLIRPQDRVDACHFNAKNVAQKLSVTSAEKAATTPLPPPPKP